MSLAKPEDKVALIFQDGDGQHRWLVQHKGEPRMSELDGPGRHLWGLRRLEEGGALLLRDDADKALHISPGGVGLTADIDRCSLQLEITLGDLLSMFVVVKENEFLVPEAGTRSHEMHTARYSVPAANKWRVLGGHDPGEPREDLLVRNQADPSPSLKCAKGRRAPSR